MSAMAAIFFSKDAGVLLFVIVAHMLWDIAEDVFMFQVSFRRWERTWGLNKKDLQDTYNELIKLEPIIDPAQEKKQSLLGRMVSRIMNKIRKKAIKA
jgi:hypothetical protein